MPLGPRALQTVQAIRWDTLRHPWGVATDLPPLFARLLDADPSEGVDRTLWERAFYQGTANGATAAVSTVLLAILEDGPSEEDAAALLHFLRVSVETDTSPTFTLNTAGPEDPALDPRAPLHAHRAVILRYAGNPDADWILAWAREEKNAPRTVRRIDISGGVQFAQKMLIYMLILVLGGLLAGWLSPF